MDQRPPDKITRTLMCFLEQMLETWFGPAASAHLKIFSLQLSLIRNRGDKKKTTTTPKQNIPFGFFFSIWGKCIYSKCYLDLSLLWWKSKYPFVWARFNSLPKTHLMDSKSCRCRFVAKGKETKQIAADNRSELNEAAKCMRDYFSLECWQSIINVSPVWCTMGLRVVAAAGPVY